MKCIATVLLAVGILSSCNRARFHIDQQALVAVTGNWLVVSTDDGSRVSSGNGTTLEITQHDLILHSSGGASLVMGKIVNFTSQGPRGEIDLQKNFDVGHGIYEVNGSDLKLIVRDPFESRPTELRGSPTGMLFTLKRTR